MQVWVDFLVGLHSSCGGVRIFLSIWIQYIMYECTGECKGNNYKLILLHVWVTLYGFGERKVVLSFSCCVFWKSCFHAAQECVCLYYLYKRYRVRYRALALRVFSTQWLFVRHPYVDFCFLFIREFGTCYKFWCNSLLLPIQNIICFLTSTKCFSWAMLIWFLTSFTWTRFHL